MRISMVNGYVCRDCADEDRARRGVDPSGRGAAGRPDRPARPDRDDPAVRAVAGVTAAQAAQQAATAAAPPRAMWENRPIPGAATGGIINTVA